MHFSPKKKNVVLDDAYFQTCLWWLIYLFIVLKHAILRLEINPPKQETLLSILSICWYLAPNYWISLLFLVCLRRFQKSQEAMPRWPLCRRRLQIFHFSAFCLLKCPHVNPWPIQCAFYILMHAGCSQVVPDSGDQIENPSALLKVTVMILVAASYVAIPVASPFCEINYWAPSSRPNSLVFYTSLWATLNSEFRLLKLFIITF